MNKKNMQEAESIWQAAKKLEEDFEEWAKTTKMMLHHIREERIKIRAQARLMRKEAEELLK